VQARICTLHDFRLPVRLPSPDTLRVVRLPIPPLHNHRRINGDDPHAETIAHDANNNVSISRFIINTILKKPKTIKLLLKHVTEKELENIVNSTSSSKEKMVSVFLHAINA